MDQKGVERARMAGVGALGDGFEIASAPSSPMSPSEAVASPEAGRGSCWRLARRDAASVRSTSSVNRTAQALIDFKDVWINP
mmetsp:Transcript_43667/g.170871  ORF Transcript_43667/g.170871 Transcript_43667/m.170871 type:complete len:82 (-) Transcript_43667:1487-1732(-)